MSIVIMFIIIISSSSSSSSSSSIIIILIITIITVLTITASPLRLHARALAQEAVGALSRVGLRSFEGN